MWLDPISRKLLEGGPPAPVCLMYHSIPPDTSHNEWEVSLKDFDQHLWLLKEFGWETQVVSAIETCKRPKTAFITFDDGYRNNYAAFKSLLEYKFVATWFPVANTIGGASDWEDNTCYAQQPMLSVDQIREMAQAGMEIGSHGLTHTRLPTLADNRIHHELRESKAALETIIGQAVNSLAYPFGIYNQTVRDIAASTGYRFACTTKSGFGLVHNDPLQIRRITVYPNDSLATFARKLVFGDNHASWYKTIRYGLNQTLTRYIKT